ncbi:MAG: hypothetical protein IJ837_03475 [Clostridia bacterium]|nr:hypothetical protein [Clostridia bacterium]
MEDFLEEIKQYKETNDIIDLVDDVLKLRKYYFSMDYNSMMQHIDHLTNKYWVETKIWNSTSSSQSTTYEQQYINAEKFLRLKGFSMLIQKGIKIQNQLTQQELSIIQNWIKPME